MAVLEAFVYDPLLNWRLMETGAKSKKSKPNASATGSILASAGGAEGGGVATLSSMAAAPADLDEVSALGSSLPSSGGGKPRDKEGGGGGEAAALVGEVDLDHQPELMNTKALDIIQRVRDKLTGKDFGNAEPLDVPEQVDRLIEQATNNQNLCQSYIGWCPFW